jgi:predicted transposase/invertase (TIGR01784 family)
MVYIPFYERDDAEKVRQEGRQEGEATGLTKGRQEGRQEGKIFAARSMLADNLPFEFIAKYSGLSVEEIASIR